LQTYRSKEITVTKHFETLAALERQMGAARQLRSETLASAIHNAVTQAMQATRRMLVRVDVHEPRQT
jgi:hypothetical protein